MASIEDESGILRRIIRMIELIKDPLVQQIRVASFFTYYGSLFWSHKQFANALFQQVDLEFVPLYVVTEIGIMYFDIKKQVYDHYIRFIKNNQQVFIILHDELRNKQFEKQNFPVDHYIDQIKQILLEDVYYERPKPLDFNSLMRVIYDRICNLPYIPNVRNM